MDWQGKLACYIVGSFLLPFNEVAIARNWEITPRLTVAETFTDNRDLEPSGEEDSDAVTEINPGVSVRSQGGRLDLGLDYNMQNLLFARDAEYEINHQLVGNGTAELVKEQFFLDADASISQVVISARDRVPLDNLSQTGNRADVITYGLSPYWQSDFAGYVEALARYRLDGVHIEEGASDSLGHTINVDLDSGRRFTSLNWEVNYAYQRIDREDEETDTRLIGEASTRQEVNAQASYWLSDAWAVLARAGYEEHDLATFTDTEDGAFWSLGIGWKPSRFIEMEALYGPDDSEFSLRLNPTTRTNLTVTRRERDVGVNTGVQWSGTFNHLTRYSTWSASYFEEVVSVQEILFTEPPFEIIGGEEGDQIVFDDQGRIINRPDVFTLRDTEFLRERFEASVDYRRGYSQFRLNGFIEDRAFETEGDDERSYLAQAGWTWRFAPRTSSILDLEWDRIEFEDDRQDDLWVVRLGLIRDLTPDVNGLLEYRYAQQDSTEPDQDYRENRVSLQLNMVF